MIRVHVDDYLPTYHSGIWEWDSEVEKITFESYSALTIKEPVYLETNGYKFLSVLNHVDEEIFIQEFQRNEDMWPHDVIKLRDVIDLVMFLAPSELITKEMIRFLNTKTVSIFLNALIIYFEYYLKLVEFIMIRRDDLSGYTPQIQSEASSEIKRIFSKYLSQYRILLAREYSKIILGEGDMQSFHHLVPIVNISKAIRDKSFHDGFLAFCTQVVWITMHRRAYEIVDMEMNRLFRSEHFKMRIRDPIKLTENERSLLFGRNYRHLNYRAQVSPLVQELLNISEEDRPIMWIGLRKYRGTDARIKQIELEYIVPDGELVFIDVSHGILGHPKKIYDTLLQLNYDAVRTHNFTKAYDPYRVLNQHCLEIPDINEEAMRKYAESYPPDFAIEQIPDTWDRAKMQKWLDRDRLTNHFRTTGVLTNIYARCREEINRKEFRLSAVEITQKFLARMRRMRKNR